MSSKGVQMDPAKVGVVMKWPTLMSLHRLRGFLGLVGYYCRFICGYGMLAVPLTALLKKENQKPQYWPPMAEAAFQALKDALTTALVWRMPDFSKPFKIECDASGRGLRAILMQE